MTAFFKKRVKKTPQSVTVSPNDIKSAISRNLEKRGSSKEDELRAEIERLKKEKEEMLKEEEEFDEEVPEDNEDDGEEMETEDEIPEEEEEEGEEEEEDNIEDDKISGYEKDTQEEKPKPKKKKQPKVEEPEVVPEEQHLNLLLNHDERIRNLEALFFRIKSII